MANRNFDSSYCIGKRLIEISGSFVPLTGSGTVVASKVKGLGFGYAPAATTGTMTLQTSARPGINSTPGILRTAAGTYTVVFDDSYTDVIYQSVDIAAPSTSGTALWGQPVNNISGLATAATAPTLTFLIVNSSGTPTDAASSQILYFHVQFRDSSVEYVKP